MSAGDQSWEFPNGSGCGSVAGRGRRHSVRARWRPRIGSSAATPFSARSPCAFRDTTPNRL